MSKKKLKVLVSSTVYGVEELLERVYSLLTAFGYDTEYGYEVQMSHKGTVPVFPNQTAFQSCLSAVEACDIFLGIITPQYGSGVDSTGLSITHQEMLKAIELDKPRWFLAHDHVVFARKLLNELSYIEDNQGDNGGKPISFRGKVGRSKLQLSKKASSISDLRVIQMYEDVTREDLKLEQRNGNWAQKFSSPEDASVFVTAQFSRYHEVETFINEQLGSPEHVYKTVKGDDDE